MLGSRLDRSVDSSQWVNGWGLLGLDFEKCIHLLCVNKTGYAAHALEAFLWLMDGFNCAYIEAYRLGYDAAYTGSYNSMRSCSWFIDGS